MLLGSHTNPLFSKYDELKIWWAEYYFCFIWPQHIDLLIVLCKYYMCISQFMGWGSMLVVDMLLSPSAFTHLPRVDVSEYCWWLLEMTCFQHPHLRDDGFPMLPHSLVLSWPFLRTARVLFSLIKTLCRGQRGFRMQETCVCAPAFVPHRWLMLAAFGALGKSSVRQAGPLQRGSSTWQREQREGEPPRHLQRTTARSGGPICPFMPIQDQPSAAVFPISFRSVRAHLTLDQSNHGTSISSQHLGMLSDRFTPYSDHRRSRRGMRASRQLTYSTDLESVLSYSHATRQD